MCLHHVAHVEAVVTYQLGYLTRQRRWRGRWLAPRVPLLRIVVEPGESIDFADPVLGFPGHHVRPPGERVLRIWGDDVLTISHAHSWAFVVQSPVSFDGPWLHLLARGAGERAAPGLAVVFASFAGLAQPGPFRVADMDMTTYSTLVHVEDHRGGHQRGR